MIKLNKTEEPDILKDNGAIWLKALTDAEAAGIKPTEAEKGRYRHRDIKAALVKETHGKCAYCESKVLATGYGDVEHVIPKVTDVNETFRWANLTLACDRCNTNKGTVEGLVDPYIEEPAQLFHFLGPMVVADPESEKARLTERVLSLNRPALFEKRVQKIGYLHSQIVVLKATRDPHLRAVLETDLRMNEIAAHQEFAAVARNFLATVFP